MALIDAPVGFALAAGTVAAFNPCGFAMLPAYLSFFVTSDATSARDSTGAAPGSGRSGAVGRALLVTAAMTAGFVAVFGAAGLAIQGASLAVGEWTPWITVIIGVVLIPMGVLMLSGREFKVSLPRLQRGGKNQNLASMSLFGMSYATVSLSCTLPVFLTAVTGSFREGNIVGGLVTYVAYALGMGLVIGVLTVALALAQDGVVRRLRRVLPHLNRVAGGLLIVTGAYVAYYGYFEIRTLAGDQVAAGPVDWITGWSSSVSERVDAIGAYGAGAALAGLVVLGVAVRRLRSPRGN